MINFKELLKHFHEKRKDKSIFEDYNLNYKEDMRYDIMRYLNDYDYFEMFKKNEIDEDELYLLCLEEIESDTSCTITWPFDKDSIFAKYMVMDNIDLLIQAFEGLEVTHINLLDQDWGKWDSYIRDYLLPEVLKEVLKEVIEKWGKENNEN